MSAGEVGRYVGNWARKYPFAPRYRRSDRTWVTTADGVRLCVARRTGPADAPLTAVLVHGFLNSSRSPQVYRFARHLAQRFHVLVPDLRGHGASGGATTLGRLESLDVAATVSLAEAGLPVVTIGTSLGGVAVILHAGTHRSVAGVVAISAPAFWGAADRPGSARVHRLLHSAAGRTMAAALMRTRIGVWDADPFAMDDAVAGIAPAFTVVVHDPEDHYFGPEHAEHLYTHAHEPKQLWWYENAGHGNDLLTPAFADRLLDDLPARVTGLPAS